MRKKNEKKKISFSRRAFDKNGVLQGNSMVTHSSWCRRACTYVKEVEKCDQKPFTASKSDKAQ